MSDKLKIFKSLFRGREDVFAIRWEKGIKSGYMPAYQFDPFFYRSHKIKGGNFNDFQDKSYLPFDDEQFHIIMETLDTEESTYFWHFDKTTHTLPIILKGIDNHLVIIRNNGRQVFLDSAPAYFSRILHDYTDEKKGFIKWKDILGERLV